MVRVKIEDIKLNKKARNSSIDLSLGGKVFSNTVKQEEKVIENIILNDKEEKNHVNYEKSIKRLTSTPQIRPKIKIIGKPIFYLFLFCLLLGVVYVVSLVFEKAKISIVAKSQIFKLEKEKFTASKIDNSDIDFEIMIINDTEKKIISLSESDTASIKAEGKVILYNEYTTTPQTILAGTYLSDENGKSYKIKKTVTIPGFKKDGNKIIPGEIEASVEAFLPGEVYNGDPKNFTFDSFKNTDKYKKLYGIANTSFTGGIQGKVYKINSQNDIDVKLFSENYMRDILFKKAQVEIPPSYLTYKQATSFSYEYDKEKLYKEQNAEILVSGSLAVILFKKEDIEKAIIKRVLPKINSKEINQIKLSDINELLFNFDIQNQTLNKETNNFEFSLAGKLQADWNPYEVELLNKLVGVDKSKTKPIMSEDKGIDMAVIKIFPPWQKYLPDDISRIKINIEKQQK